jgi:hypothetical protein
LVGGSSLADQRERPTLLFAICPALTGPSRTLLSMSGSPDGPWICCPWCGAEILLSLFAPSDDEPGAAVAVCRGCHRRVLLSDGSGRPA